jgi:hypothetical protein
MTDNFLSTTPKGLVPLLKSTVGVAPTMIWGAPGIGKTAIIQDNVAEIFAAAAADRGIKVPDDAKVELFERRVNDYDLLDFGGLPFNDNGVQRRATPDIWPGVEGGDKVYGILLLDEIPQAAREKQTVIQRLFDQGRIGDYVLPGHPKSDPTGKRGLVLIVLAGNRQSDRANSHGMGSQTGTRLIHVTLEPDTNDWIDYANANDVDPTVVSFIKQEPEYLHKLDPKQVTGSTPRGLVILSKLVGKALPSDIEMTAYAGAVGEECSRAFLALVHAARSINIDEALVDPEGAEIPQEVGHQFATASLLIRRATTENFDNIVKYVERVGDGEFSTPEIAVFVVEAIKRRVPVLAESVTYRDFSLRWADIRS